MPNIFFTQENLVFSLPLIAVCVVYAYIKFIPLVIGIPLVGVFVLLIHLYSKYRHYKIEQSLTELVNDDVVKELTLDEDMKQNKLQHQKAKKERKASEKTRLRLKEERKAAAAAKKSRAKSKNQNDDHEEAEDADDADLLTFMKGSRDVKKKN